MFDTSCSTPLQVTGNYSSLHQRPHLSSYPLVEGKLIRGFEGLDVGDQVRVELIETDVERGFIDFARVDEDKEIEIPLF